ncbi:MAG: SUMF1/EgtB/PvdO family nonheme iron enzyme [Planctomycetaceae bacterium]|nr:SUMF1/EgtB/PvdO family nonheme iron enzyme [Planctomycetaceae bacterium]
MIRHLLKYLPKHVTIAACLLTVTVTTSRAQQTTTADKAIAVRQAVDSLNADLRPPNRWALVIGVGDYADRDIPDLPACVNDGRAMQTMLTDPLRGLIPPDHVKLLLDADVTREKVVEALVWLKRQAAEDDLVLVYFSGHGAVDAEGTAYWLMQNSQLKNLRGTAFEELNITRLLEEISSDRLVVLVDACFAAATAHAGMKAAVVDVSRLFRQFDGTGRVLICSSNGQEPSLVISDSNHPGHGHSVFTWHLLEAVGGAGDANHDGVITLEETWKYLSPAVRKTATELGGRMTPNLKGQLGGELLLAVDSPRLIRLQYDNEQARLQRTQRLRRLKELALDELITDVQYREGKRLLELLPTELTPAQAATLGEYVNVLDGTLTPEKLQRAIQLAMEDVPPTSARVPDTKPVVKPEAELKAGDIDTIQLPGDVEMKFIYCPPGKFRMGAFKYEDGVEVELTRGFWIGETEVTQAQWTAVMQTEPWIGGDEIRLGDDVPAVYIRQGDNGETPLMPNSASLFCVRLTELKQRAGELSGSTLYALPTEAQWEYAYRAGTTTVFPYFPESPRDVWYYHYSDEDRTGPIRKKLSEFEVWDVETLVVTTEQSAVIASDDDGRLTPYPVKSRKPNPWGIFDMGANVKEWTADVYRREPTGGVDPFTYVSPIVRRVVRGWSAETDFSGSVRWPHPGVRGGYEPADRYSSHGFRIVRVTDRHPFSNDRIPH